MLRPRRRRHLKRHDPPILSRACERTNLVVMRLCPLLLTALVLTACKSGSQESAITVADGTGLQVDTTKYPFRKNESNDRRIELPERKPTSIETTGFEGFPPSTACKGCTLVMKYTMEGADGGSLIFSASNTGISFESYPRSFESDFTNPDEKADTARQLPKAHLQSIRTENIPECPCQHPPCKVSIRLIP